MAPDDVGTAAVTLTDFTLILVKVANNYIKKRSNDEEKAEMAHLWRQVVRGLRIRHCQDGRWPPNPHNCDGEGAGLRRPYGLHDPRLEGPCKLTPVG